FYQCSLENHRRLCHRRHRERHRSQRHCHGRRYPPHAIRQHAQLRRLGRRRSAPYPSYRLLAHHPGHGGPVCRGRSLPMMLPGMLTSLILIPIVGALAILVLRGDDHKFIKGLALGVSLFEFGFSLLLLLPRNMKFAVAGYQLEENFHWITSPPIRYHLGVDGLSVFLVILTTFLTAISVIASWNNVHERIKEFFVTLLMLEVGIVGVFLSLDLFLFFLFWEVMLIPMAFLIGIWGHGRKIYAAVKFVLYTMAGSALMVIGIIWLYNLSGSFDLPVIQQALQTGAVSLTHLQELLLFLAFFVAFAIKVPLFPLHTWLPDAHVEAPTAGSIILAGVLLKMGTYGMM